MLIVASFAPTLSGVNRAVNVAFPPGAIEPAGVSDPSVNCPGFVPPKDSPEIVSAEAPVFLIVKVTAEERSPVHTSQLPPPHDPVDPLLLAPPKSATAIV